MITLPPPILNLQCQLKLSLHLQKIFFVSSFGCFWNPSWWVLGSQAHGMAHMTRQRQPWSPTQTIPYNQWGEGAVELWTQELCARMSSVAVLPRKLWYEQCSQCCIMMISSLQMFEVTKYKDDFSFNKHHGSGNQPFIYYCPSVRLWSSLWTCPFEVWTWVVYNTYLHSYIPCSTLASQMTSQITADGW